MKKLGILLGLVVLVAFIGSENTVCSFRVENIYTTSNYADVKYQEKTYFEPGDTVYIHADIVYCGNQPINPEMEFTVFNFYIFPIGDIFFESVPVQMYLRSGRVSYGEHRCERECCMIPLVGEVQISREAPTGEYAIVVRIHDKISHSQKKTELTIFVDYYKAKKYLEEADSSFECGNYENAKYLYKCAEYEIEKSYLQLELSYCRERIIECEKYIQAEEYKRKQAEEYYSKAEQYLREKDYQDAVDNFEMARNLYEELGDEILVQICNNQIKDNSGIRFFINELMEIPSATNLSVITWLGCAYILFKESRKVEKEKMLVIFSFVVIVASSVIFIEFYFHDFYYILMFLVIIMSGALTLGILLKRYKKKIYPNPYIAGNPIRSREIFFGRKDVFQFIGNKLRSQMNVTIVLHGERRTGKTSILYQIENGKLGKEFFPVYMDMQEMARVNEIEFFAKITEKIVESLTRNGILDFASTSHFGINELVKDYRVEPNPYQVFNRFLDILSNVLKEKYLLLMLDEYEILEKKMQNKHLSSDIIHYLRNQMQSREKISFIFAGSRKLEELEAKNWSLMFNAAVYKKISFLEKEDAINLITVPVENQIYYTDEAINKILRLTACHPYFLQLFLQNVVDHMNDIEKREVTGKEVTHVLQYLLDNPAPHMIYIWQDSTNEQNMVLSALSEVIETEEEYISVKRIEETLSHNGVKCDADSIKRILRVLYQKELIDHKSTGYNFKIDLLRHWIKTEHPLFKILEEIPRTPTPTE